jgi:hypothetical protein
MPSAFKQLDLLKSYVFLVIDRPIILFSRGTDEGDSADKLEFLFLQLRVTRQQS